MKKIIILLGLWSLATLSWAQNDEAGAKIVTPSEAIQVDNIGVKNNKYVIQVGVPYFDQNSNSSDSIDVRFPWDANYFYDTFSEDAFDVSKGYFGDKILISWEVKNNSDKINTFKIYRRKYNPFVEGVWGNPIGSVASGISQYEDKYVDGGILYEYKVYADGVDNLTEIKETNFITGIGFRNPTAVVTGSVSFKGGNPVKDVTLMANSDGGDADFGSALNIAAAGQVEIRGISGTISNEATLQAWIKPGTPYTDDSGDAIRLFRLIGTDSIDVHLKLKATSNILEVDIAGSVYALHNYYPSGKTNSRGDDILLPAAEFNSNFVHVSLIIKDGSIPTLFINGRAISDAYREEAHSRLFEADTINYTAPYFYVTIPGQANASTLLGTDIVIVGGGNSAILDEIRVWKSALDTFRIRTDYRRYISGNNTKLVSYLSANEGLGQFAYDFAREGFNYNKNNGKLISSTWVSGAGNVPSADQLGILGVTDENGNFQITSIPYSGTGESFTITPLYGQHQFEPSQQLVFLGEGSEVVNKLDFIDKSSFSFKGKVIYDSRDIFKSIVELDGIQNSVEDIDYISGPGILDEGYNYYEKSAEKYSKGQYWYNATEDRLERFATVFSEGVSIYVDGNIILDENNFPVTTDEEGFFDVRVPIGNHFISVRKDGHEFTYGGRFPAKTGDPEADYKEFFEDSNEPVFFIDTTRVSVVGRVVGGAVESQKEIGFGGNGLFEKSIINNEGQAETVTISSKNNIGVADIALGYDPPEGDITKYTTHYFATDSASGEYRIELLPLKYDLAADKISILNNGDNISILETGTTESVDYTEVGELTTPEFELPDGSKEFGEPFHFSSSWNYRSIPVLRAIEQTSKREIRIQGITYNSTGFKYPLYAQFEPYRIVLSSFEQYRNYDADAINPTEDIVPVIDGELIINNQLANPESEKLETDQADPSRLIYTFKGGNPSFSVNNEFKKTIDIKYNVNGKNYPAEDYIPDGIVIGKVDDGSKTFITTAPDVPDIILRDPPGSNSFASIEAGESVSITAETAFADSEGISESVRFQLGSQLSAGVGVINTAAIEDSFEEGISLNYTSDNGESLTKTYNFSQTISTSDEPEWVGADADLYIGNASNYFYTSFNELQVRDKITGDPAANIPLINELDDTVFVSVQRIIGITPDPAETFFVYTQKYILESLIPEYELFIFNINNGLLTPGDDGVLTVEQYEEQISMWKKTILKNELSKYLAVESKRRAENKMLIDSIIFNFNNELITLIDDSDDPLGEFKLIGRLEEANRIKEIVDKYWEDNVSFDAGVGEITRSIESTTVNTNTTAYNITLDESLQLEFGTTINKTGVIATGKAFFQQSISSALSSEEQSTTTFSYTLKDSDEANLLSVDVVNDFGAYGPVFTTQGGRTSCPYEGGVESKFLSKNQFEEYLDSYFSIEMALNNNKESLIHKRDKVNDPGQNRAQKDLLREEIKELETEKFLLENQRAEQWKTFSDQVDSISTDVKADLSFATQKVEVPLLSVEVADVSNVLEGKNAEFLLRLENNSAAGIDADFLLKIDNTSNPNNALINIEQNGTIVHVPYGESIEYVMTLGKSVSDVYDYEDIRVMLQSICDGEEVSADVLVSAHFVPACSEVVVSAPLSNWVYNIDAAYQLDGSTKPLTINMIGFSTDFDSFEKIHLEYRLASAPNWKRLQTYYGDQQSFDDALQAGESQISLIESPTISYALDVVGLNFQDGEYEIRARSSCTNDTEFISEVVTGRVDLNSPQRFGTPLPVDGIMGPGEDIKVRFNEPVFYNSAVSFIEIKGQTNQLPINNNVSLYFEGANNTTVINNPGIASGDFTMEFWMKNSTTNANAHIIKQNDGLEIGLMSDELFFTLANYTAKGAIATDGLFHHYTFTYSSSSGDLRIYRDDAEVNGISAPANLQFTNSNDLVIGGNTFIGNIHDLRLWNKTIGLENAYARMYDKLIGNEASLIGYWPMSEGRGNIANDLARFKYAQVNTGWDIKPKGNSYEFANGQYLSLDNVDFVQMNREMDATISFWMKTGNAQVSTLFSNGKGDGSDPVQSNGLTNKWAINMTSSGMLTFESEGNSYLLTSQQVADDKWHHITLLFNRIGSLRTYVDAEQVSSHPMENIGGFSGNTVWLGARGAKDPGIDSVLVDQEFSGKIDEFRLWNTLRNVEQISRDRFNEVDTESKGLLLYARMNAPDPATGNGPRYYHAYSNQTVISSTAVISSGSVNYGDDVPPIKPERALIKFQVNRVVNGDEMILEPVVTDWASLEGQVVDITVLGMFDDANNKQQSPITWTAYIRRNEVSWFTEGYNEIVDLIKNSGEKQSFDITLLNKGGNPEPYSITNVPPWLKLSSNSGTIAPDSKIVVTATINQELAPGKYLENLYLQTDFGYDEKMQVKLRVLEIEPDWTINPNDYDFSMNIVGKIKVDGVLSEDSYDKVGAFHNDQVRGNAYLFYNDAYQEYLVYLTVYSNISAGEVIDFSIWDATQGRVLKASLDGNITMPFLENQVVGTLSSPGIFENTLIEEQYIDFNKGWTWISFNVDDENFDDLNMLTANLNLETSDRILSHSPAQLETYFKDVSTPSNSSWNGDISNGGGLTSDKVYKVNLNTAQTLKVEGPTVEITSWSFPIKQNWNWLPYPLSANKTVNEALAYFEAVAGDVIKSQNLFSIYDPIIGWTGTLNYLEEGKGYMISSGKDQVFEYPVIIGNTSNGKIATRMQENILPQYQKYRENMNAVVRMPEGFDHLLIYDDDNTLKGMAISQIVNGTDLSFITIYGELPENLTFHIGNTAEIKATSKTITFKANEVLGTIANPLVLEELWQDRVTVYPNPFDNKLSIQIFSDQKQEATVQIFSVMGQIITDKIFEVKPGLNKLAISLDVASGVHIMQVSMNGKTTIQRVIRK